jgi:hypothetical protein
LENYKGVIHIKRVLLLTMLLVGYLATAASATEIRYGIDTYDHISSSTADVDIVNREIRLPKHAPNVADFLDGFEYIYLSPEGIQKVNTDGTTTPVATDIPDPNNITAIAGSGNYPDFIVAQGNSITHYSFTGSQYIPNPALSSAGYTGIVSIGTKELDHAVLSDGIKYMGYTDAGSVALVPDISTSGFDNPIAMAVFQDHYGTVVIDGNTVKYFKEGNTVTATITGLSNVVSISASDGGNIAVVADGQIKHYNLIDNEFQYNSVLSITTGLTKPTCVATRPGSYDKLIVDGDEIKYYMWTGTSLELNPVLSRTVVGLQSMGKYVTTAFAESIIYSVEDPNYLKLYIDPELQPQEPGTSIQWYITVEAGDTPTWTPITPNTWVQVSAEQIRWKAVLNTMDPNYTPRINPDIVILVNSKPKPPTTDIPPMTGEDKCYYNTSPVIRWVFNDSPEDSQGGFQVIISGGSMTEDSGIIESSATEYTVDANATGKLFNSGVDTFTVTIRVWDELGIAMGAKESDSAVTTAQFCVTAFENPRVSLRMPAEGSLAVGDIPKNSTSDELLKTRAGGLITFEVRSIGIDTAQFNFPYAEQQSTIANTWNTAGTNKVWGVEFYTDANTDKCPDGTIVYGSVSGNGIPDLMYLNETIPGEMPPSSWWQWDGYRKWADGVVSVGGSIFEDWSVVIQGRE